MPAMAGEAALVPKNVDRTVTGTLVLTPSAPDTCGFCLTSGLASRVPALSNRCVTGPRELKGSGVAGVG